VILNQLGNDRESDKNHNLKDNSSRSNSARVELSISNVLNINDIYNWVKEIPNHLPAFAVSNINISDNRILLFDLVAQKKENIEAKEIGPEIKKIMESTKPPFQVHEGKIVVSDLWSWD
jgi:hypothetical protein